MQPPDRDCNKRKGRISSQQMSPEINIASDLTTRNASRCHCLVYCMCVPAWSCLYQRVRSMSESVSVFASESVYLCLCLFVCLSVCVSVNVFVCWCVTVHCLCLSVRLYLCRSVPVFARVCWAFHGYVLARVRAVTPFCECVSVCSICLLSASVSLFFI